VAATHLAGPTGQVMRGLLADALRHPELLRVLRERILGTRRHTVHEILRRAIDRGDARPEALSGRLLDLGPALLTHHFLLHNAPIDDTEIIEIVDIVMLPLIRT
jgi:hypothetical protein